MITTEKKFESDIEYSLVSAEGGYTKTSDKYDTEAGLYITSLITFVKRTQPKEWARFDIFQFCSSAIV